MMNARQMFARYAQGGMVDEVGELRANTGGDVSKARQMLQNLQSPVRRFADGGTVTEEDRALALARYNLLPAGVRATHSAADRDAMIASSAQTEANRRPPPPAATTTTAPTTAPYETRDLGLTSKAPPYSQQDITETILRAAASPQAQDFTGQQLRDVMAKTGFTQEDLRVAFADPRAKELGLSNLATQAVTNPSFNVAYGSEPGVGGFAAMTDYLQNAYRANPNISREEVQSFLTKVGANEADLRRAGFDLAQFRKAAPDILGPTKPLPDLTETFTPPTAPPPEAPPPALTAGAEGLAPETAIVGKIPESERVQLPQLDTEFRASEPRTAVYDRFGRISGYNYTPAAKLTPATGTNVFNFVPPGITSRPRSLLNLGDVPGVTVDPVTGQMRMPLSASQQFARDRSTLDNQFRQLYARAAASDASLPAQAPAGAAAAFRQFAMSDPTMSAQLRMRDIEQTPTVNPTPAMTAARSQFGQAPYAAALTEAFDPFLARNRAALTALAQSATAPKSYSEMYPDIAAAYTKLSAKDKEKYPTLQDYELYHFDTYGNKEGRMSPLQIMANANPLQSPYGTAFFSKGGEASVEDFVKKQSGGDVSRGTASPNTAEVPQLDAEGRLIDEREEIRSESQRMLNRLQSQPSKLPPGLRRTVAATKAQGTESMIPAAAPARDLLSGIIGASPTAPGSEAYRTGQALANMPPVQAAAAIPAKIAASAGDAATALAAMGPAVGAVIKPKGGNWLAPSVERGLNYLIPRTGAANRTAKETLEEMNRTYPAEELAKMSPETRASVDRAYQWLEPNVAIQNWVEKKLTKYVKNEMATPEDPVRALAERGILHIDPEQLNSYPGAGNPLDRAVARRALGYPEEGLAKSEAAKRWETASDYMIQTDRALNLLNPKEYGQGFVDQTLAANPWLTKIDPYERIYGVDTLTYRPDYSELGFDHLIDELKNSLNPNSGLPRALQLTPKQLDKVSMPQAVELVNKINKWRAEQKAAADLKIANNAATVEYKAYDMVPGTSEPNKRGLRWVELKPATMSEDFVAPDRYSIVRPAQSAETFAIKDNETGRYITTGLKSEEQARRHLFDTLNRQQLEEALKYEGDVMGHCVGGYCPDVESGRSRIYSLRDKKGEPHVTIEVEPEPNIGFRQGEGPKTQEERFDLQTQWMKETESGRIPGDITFATWWRSKNNIPEPERKSQISQIKGKGNGEVAKKYWAFGQDFVKSGNWSKVNDLENIGLIKIDPVSDLTKSIRAAGGEPPKFVTQQELTELLRQYGDPTKGYKKGGPVDVSRETSTSKQQLDKLAQVSQRKKA